MRSAVSCAMAMRRDAHELGDTCAQRAAWPRRAANPGPPHTQGPSAPMPKTKKPLSSVPARIDAHRATATRLPTRLGLSASDVVGPRKLNNANFGACPLTPFGCERVLTFGLNLPPRADAWHVEQGASTRPRWKADARSKNSLQRGGGSADAWGEPVTCGATDSCLHAANLLREILRRACFS